MAFKNPKALEISGKVCKKDDLALVKEDQFAEHLNNEDIDLH